MASLRDRVAREAQNQPLQAQVLAFLSEQKDKLIDTADRGEPPVSVVSASLLETFGDDIRGTRPRQFVGLCVAALLEEAGFELVRSGVRLPQDPLFTAGSIFRRASVPVAVNTDDLLDRFLQTLTRDELRYAADQIRRILGR